MGRKLSKSIGIKPLPSALTVASLSEHRSVQPLGKAQAAVTPKTHSELVIKPAPKRARVRSKTLPVKDPQTPPPDGVPFQATALPAATRKINVTFLFPEPDAKQVFVCGSFND